MRTTRARQGRSIRIAAKEAGVNRELWGELEKGTARSPRAETLGKVELYFGWEPGSIDEFLGGRRSELPRSDGGRARGHIYVADLPTPEVKTRLVDLSEPGDDYTLLISLRVDHDLTPEERRQMRERLFREIGESAMRD